ALRRPRTPHIPTLSLHDALPISGKDPVTGEDIVEIAKYEVHAVVTVMSSDRVLRRHLELGVEYKTGDIIVDINKEDFPADMDYEDRKSTRLNSSHVSISYAVLCL